MEWKNIDEKLIRRGEIILALEFVDDYAAELQAMNRDKVGHPYILAKSYIEFLAIIHYLFDVPYRQLEGFTIALKRLIPKLPSGDYSGLRKRIIRLDFSPYKELKGSDTPMVIAVDSTGIKVHKAGDWIKQAHGMRKHYIKIHFAVNVETKEIVAMEITRDNVHDSKVFPKLLKKAEKNGKVVKVIADGAYDTAKIHKLLESKGIYAAIKLRRNSRLDTPSEARRKNVSLYRGIGYRAWTKLKGYGKRWSVETVYSSFKRIFGEFCLANIPKNIKKELFAKAFIYNMLVNL